MAETKLTPSEMKQVQYETTFIGPQITIVCTLPPGFTMRSFTKILNISNAVDYKMDLNDYLAWQKDVLFQDLLARIERTKGAKNGQREIHQ